MFNPKDVKAIKDIVDWLNSEFPGSDKKIAAYYIKGDLIDSWHICCQDMFTWESAEYKASVEAIRELYPNIRMIFPFLYCVHMFVLRKRKETVHGAPVILVR